MDYEKEFEAWWATQLVPPDDQGDWNKREERKELSEIAEDFLPVLKMWAFKGFRAGKEPTR